MKTFELSNKQSTTNGRKQTIESIRKKSYWEPEWVNKITKGVIDDSNRANSLRDALKIKETDNTLTRWDNELTQLNEMTRERKEKEHIKEFVTNSFPRAQLDDVQKPHLLNSLSTAKPRISSSGTNKIGTMLYTGGKVTPTNAFKKGNDTPEFEQVSFSGGFGNQGAGSIGKTAKNDQVTEQSVITKPAQVQEDKSYLTKPEDDFSDTYGTTIEKQDEKLHGKTYLGNDSPESRKKATNCIKYNSQTIIETANKYDIDPVTLACCIYTEQACNVTLLEPAGDPLKSLKDPSTSVGIAQVAVKTAKSLEENGYMKEPIQKVCSLFNNYDVWKIPGINQYYFGSFEGAVRLRALNMEQSIEYAAAYLKSIQDLWENEYPDIYEDSAILSTLYNIGENGSQGPHGNPQPNDFGRYARANYYYMENLLGL